MQALANADGALSLHDPWLRGIHDSDGDLIPGTADGPWGDGGDDPDNNYDSYHSRVLFTPDDAGTYYIAAGSGGHTTGTYELSVEEVM